MSYTNIDKPATPSYGTITGPSSLISPIINDDASIINSISDTIDDYVLSIYTTMPKPSF